MENPDVDMGEDSVIQSTETNGYAQPQTVNPQEVLRSAPMSKREQLPFHSPSRPTAFLNPDAHRSQPSSQRATHSPRGHSQKRSPSHSMAARASSPQVRIPPAPRSSVLPHASLRTGLVYDPRMRFHTELPNMSMNADDIHPEDPRRIHSIFQEIKEAGLVGPSSLDDDIREDHCWRIGIRPATRPEILLIHTAEHYDFVESLQNMTSEDLRAAAEALDSIYFNSATYECAMLAAGGAIEACKAVVEGSVRNAIAIIRPPGHHAESTQPSGFCIFNNVPIATRVCQDAFPETCRKVLILDWDVHHGNGIQHAFYEDPNVLYISLHVYKNRTFYPHLLDGNLDYCGAGPGEGKNVNIPWADHGMGDAEYLYAFQEVVMPIATEFDPDLVIISAGFDAADGDLLGGCHVTPACFGHMTHMLMRLARGKLVVCLEGGYNLRSIARSALAVTRVLMQEPPDRLSEDVADPKDSAVRTVQQVKRQHSKYWKCLYPKYLERTDPGFKDAFRLNEIIRQWQSQCLGENHSMTPIQIHKAGLSQTFEHNVIATPDFVGRHPLLVIFHDPPSFRDNLDPVTGMRELHNTWLTDVTKSYIDWAISNDFQVIDVNIPCLVAVDDADVGYTKADDSAVRAHQTRELANYIWENYIEPGDSTQVFFMGVGDAYLGLVDLLSVNENCTDEDGIVECLIGFVADSTIQSIKRATDDNISSWYHDHSMIFVKNSHFVWDPSRQRKLRKKLGRLVQSPKETLDDMLEEHLEDVQNLLLERKSELGESDDYSSRTDDGAQAMVSGLRSPPLPGGSHTPRRSGPPEASRSPLLPPVGMWTVPDSRSPRSPMRRAF
ncbi:Histone deacetylase hda1 [Coniothyrium glycines]